jgi:hypothetical protein
MACPDGQTSGQDGTQCIVPLVDCAPGEFNNETHIDCMPCPVNTITASSGLHECTVCAPDTFAPIEGMSQCEPCKGVDDGDEEANTSNCIARTSIFSTVPRFISAIVIACASLTNLALQFGPVFVHTALHSGVL